MKLAEYIEKHPGLKPLWDEHRKMIRMRLDLSVAVPNPDANEDEFLWNMYFIDHLRESREKFVLKVNEMIHSLKVNP